MSCQPCASHSDFCNGKIITWAGGHKFTMSAGDEVVSEPCTWCKFEYLENVVSGLIVLSEDTSGSQRYCELRTVPLQDKIYSGDRSRKERKTKASQSKQSE